MSTNKWIITRIKLLNFKGFHSLDFYTNNINALILGGKNGFGKTTIFDAIQLVLTGKINRYQSYCNYYQDGRRTLSQTERPLAYDPNLPEVRIDIYIQTESNTYIFTRKTNTCELGNPISFIPFEKLYYRQNEEDNLQIVNDEILHKLNISSFLSNFDFLNYISQEEAISFLKSKETERADNLQKLFNTKVYDDKIRKIDKHILYTAKIQKQKLVEKQVFISNEIKELEKQTGITNKNIASDTYIRLTNSDSRIEWDEEHPQLSYDEYHTLLSENGTLDQLLYYVSNQQEFLQYKSNCEITEIIGKIDLFSFYFHYKNKVDFISTFRLLEKETIEPLSSLSLETINQYKLVIPPQLLHLFAIEDLADINSKIEEIRTIQASATSTEKIVNDIQDKRIKLASVINQHAHQLSIDKCPLCGHSYESDVQLLASITQAANQQISNIQILKNLAADKLEKVRQTIKREVLNITKEYFDKNGINEDIVKSFIELNKIQMELFLHTLKNYYKNINPEATLAETESLLKTSLSALIKPLKENINYESLQKTYESYIRSFSPLMLETNNLNSKRSYLVKEWNHRLSTLVEQKKKEQEKRKLEIEKYTTFINNLSALKKKIDEQKKAYLHQVISDIEILFYIYSGRIMQDSFYGRGLFMKVNGEKYVSFVTKYKHDVDVLYNMSSGQLVAVVLALMLSINKLYSTHKFLAIDDPIQTIDDINIWGFIETLRHEFRDYTFLFSTHEPQYGALLRYKLSTFGISAIYKDMMIIRKENTSTIK